MSDDVRIDKSGKYAFFEGMTWPVPGKEFDDVLWRLKYGEATVMDRHYAASVMGAYSQAIFNPLKTQAKRVACIRKAQDLLRGEHRMSETQTSDRWPISDAVRASLLDGFKSSFRKEAESVLQTLDALPEED